METEDFLSEDEFFMKNSFCIPVYFRKWISLPASFVFLFVFPASTNYQLKDFGFGSGGEENMSSAGYAIDGITGEQSKGALSGGSYTLGSGLLFTQQANVPPAPTFTNPSNYYNKSKVVLATGSNPTDTKFAIAISADNFVADTRYVQSDNTTGAVLGPEDYQTYTAWGGAGGMTVIGLASSTTYTIKVKAIQGKFTETGYGPTATVATISPTLSFAVNINSINFGNLTAGAVVNSPQNIVADFSTNGESGGSVFLYGKNGGLLSASNGYQINSATADLTPANEGFGAQGVSATQSSGGPLSIVSPYNVSGANVGVINTSIRETFASTGPIVGGQGTLILKAKSSSVTPAAGDYSETLTVVASGRF